LNGHNQPTPKVTIADVAKAAGVSKTLVSFVLNGRSDVSDTTRKRIETVITELDYHPNRQARLLVQRKTGVVGLLLEVRTYTDLLVLHFLSALGERLSDFGYGLLLLRSGKHSPLEAAISPVQERKVDGLVLMDVLRDDPRAEWLEAVGFPYVLYSSPDQQKKHYVDVDYDAGAELVVSRLVAGGHSSIGLVSGPVQYQYVHRREASFRQAAERCGLRLEERHCFHGDLTEESGRVIGARLAALGQRPTALFAVTDMIAQGVMRGLIDGGIQVPREMAVIGYGDTPSAAGTRPALTTVHIPMSELGVAAADRIIARINGEEPVHPSVLIPHLVLRDSG